MHQSCTGYQIYQYLVKHPSKITFWGRTYIKYRPLARNLYLYVTEIGMGLRNYWRRVERRVERRRRIPK